MVLIKISFSFLLFFGVELFADICIVPNILLETIKITENERRYPFYIRTNEKIEQFYNIANRFIYKKTKDKYVIDCLNKDNCSELTKTLIKNNITNLDLGLFQINYNSFKYPLHSYFDIKKSYINACEIVEEKIKINKGRWNWEVLASYHSTTPKYNNIYKKKLINNYIKLLTQLQK
ncbi:hypothetical protein H0A43_00015 [Arcobacter lanthieri]|uniref:hypothetical protein n=1 Tax=Aliarcobacter lanthieri TaxID=1355374 RepID=UPI0019243C16|nr:hypothetical protein [Aliarcobacter lanthieri]MBL3518857.1 hypothetical protein [Aliarcobacter lanthieri]